MKRLILASGSPRRRVLLECMGLEFEVIPSNFDEQLDDTRSAQEVAIELGLGKATEVSINHPDAYVIGSDTIVSIDNRQVAKPENKAEALKMLQDISGRTHQIITSVVLVNKKLNLNKWLVSTADISFKPLPQDVMDAYIATGDPYDKAGGYAVQHPLIKPFVIDIKGDLHAEIGMPTDLLGTLLREQK